MPPLVGKELEWEYEEKYSGNTLGVFPRIHFTYQYLAEQCKRAALQKSLKDLSFCSKIPVPGYYQKNKKYGLRKEKTYKGKPHDTHIRVFKKKHADKVRRCKCFICGEEGHFARECRRKQGNIARAAIIENLDLSDDWDILSVEQNEPDSDAICSFSEGEVGMANSLSTNLNDIPYETIMMVADETQYPTWRKQVTLPATMTTCVHQWEDNGPVTKGHEKCWFCKGQTNPKMRAHCKICLLTTCPTCSRFNLGQKLTIHKPNLPPYDNKDALINELLEYTKYLLVENQRLKEKVQEYELSQEMAKLEIEAQRKGKFLAEENESEDEEEYM